MSKPGETTKGVIRDDSRITPFIRLVLPGGLETGCL